TIPLDVTEHVGLVVVTGSSTTRLSVTYTTATALEQSLISCQAASGTKQVSGSVTGIPSGSIAYVSISKHGASTTSSYSLSSLPEGTIDLFASRRTATVSSVIPDRVVVRRGLNPDNGAV